VSGRLIGQPMPLPLSTSAARRLGMLASLVALSVIAGCGGNDMTEANDVIAFTVNNDGWNEVWKMAASGEDATRLTESEPPDNDASGSAGPAWSPDGTRIAFAAQIGSKAEDPRLTEIYVMNADGSEKRRLTTNRDNDQSPSWSPDGTKIAFARIIDPGSANTRSGIYVLDFESGRETRITDVGVPVFDLDPAWSPDGAEIAFTRASISGDATAIYAISPEGAGLHEIVPDGFEPSWSPDGRQIAFTSTTRDEHLGQTCFHECGPSREIYVAEVASGESRRLTSTEADDQSPSWSPDGTRIAFSSDRSNRQQHDYEIYVMASSGDDVRRVTDNDVWDMSPAWRP
jgi:Tol biopolymer transport system component